MSNAFDYEPGHHAGDGCTWPTVGHIVRTEVCAHPVEFVDDGYCNACRASARSYEEEVLFRRTHSRDKFESFTVPRDKWSDALAQVAADGYPSFWRAFTRGSLSAVVG